MTTKRPAENGSMVDNKGRQHSKRKVDDRQPQLKRRTVFSQGAAAAHKTSHKHGAPTENEGPPTTSSLNRNGERLTTPASFPIAFCTRVTAAELRVVSFSYVGRLWGHVCRAVRSAVAFGGVLFRSRPRRVSHSDIVLRRPIVGRNAQLHVLHPWVWRHVV